MGIASEGSFGPHPYIPILLLGRELVFLIDLKRGLALAGTLHGDREGLPLAGLPNRGGQLSRSRRAARTRCAAAAQASGCDSPSSENGDVGIAASRRPS
jgi:hypothetical protein